MLYERDIENSGGCVSLFSISNLDCPAKQMFNKLYETPDFVVKEINRHDTICLQYTVHLDRKTSLTLPHI